MIETRRDRAANVKRWRDGQMVLRWIATGMGEAAKQSAASTATCTCPPYGPRWTQPPTPSHRPGRMPPDHPDGPPPKFHGTRDILPDQPIDACLIPSQLLATELLRRPLEYAENTSVKRLNALPTAGPFLAH
jgi:hypothetical protein